MDLHVNYEKAKPFVLKFVVGARHDAPKSRTQSVGTRHAVSLRAKLKVDKDSGAIIIDDETTLTVILKEVWAYKLSNRSALEWVLDHYKERTPSDPTIAEMFNTYKFTDYKKELIELLKKVCKVSIEKMKVVSEMERR